jgi:hypothetical protein
LLSRCRLWRKDGTRGIKKDVKGSVTTCVVGVVRETSAILKVATFPFGVEGTGVMADTMAGWAGGGLLPERGTSTLNRFIPIPILIYLPSW